MKNVEIELTARQAQLLTAAINAEIIKGAGTFLSDDDVKNLGQIMNRLKTELLYV